MSRVSPAQMKKLLDLLSEDGVLVDGKVSYSKTSKQAFWKHIAMQLNAVEGGVHKNTWKWCKMWADWKNKTKKKANIVLRRKSYNFEHPSPTLTNLELRLLRLIDYPMDDKAELLQLHNMVNKNETLDSMTEDIPVEFLVEDYVLPSDKEKMSSDDDQNTADFLQDKDDLKDDKLFELESDDESTDTETRKNRKVKKSKSKKTSRQDSKTKATLALEKEKALQRREELRLRAIELKLKGEELRLKELEMSKVNYLTNLEEEKVKCFREISASLKEFLERTRTGNIRFHNVI